MKNRSPRSDSVSKNIVLARADPIRIVPLKVPPGLVAHRPGIAALPQPSVTYRGGPLLTSVEVFTIFWGSSWRTAHATLASQINDFFRFIVTSPLLDQMGEYSVRGYTIGHGRMAGAAIVSSPVPKRSVTDSALRQFLQQQIAGNRAVAQPGPNLLYFVYLPPGTAVTMGGGRSCQAFCGYHDAIDGRVFYAVMPYPNCRGCSGGMKALDALTSTSSHEMCEAITDAVPGTGSSATSSSTSKIPLGSCENEAAILWQPRISADGSPVCKGRDQSSLVIRTSLIDTGAATAGLASAERDGSS